MKQAYLEKLVGKDLEVLFEEEDGAYWIGHTPNYVKVYAVGEDLHNQVRNVVITGVFRDGLKGQME